jgi:hypothetical protein
MLVIAAAAVAAAVEAAAAAAAADPSPRERLFAHAPARNSEHKKPTISISDRGGPFNEMATDVAAARPLPVKKTLSDCPLALLPTEVSPSVSEASVSALKSTESAGKAVGALCVALVASLYYITLYPSLPGGDSGELIVASCSLGLPHPPGYPLFAMIGWLFTHIPFGSIAWRVNLFSAVCGVIASAFL